LLNKPVNNPNGVFSRQTRYNIVTWTAHHLEKNTPPRGVSPRRAE
jgi:hypothetical protein